MKQNFQIKTNFLKILFFLSVCIFETIQLENFDPLNSSTQNIPRKCYHKRSSHQKYFYSGNDRRAENYSASDVKFEKLRIHFDFTHTLKYEEKILKDLIIPPVKKLLENTLKIRRFPGKIRFPRSFYECEGVPVPNYLKTDGVDSDLIILVSTYRGVKKYKYEQKLLSKGIGGNFKMRIQKSSMMDYFNHKLKRTNFNNKFSNISNTTKISNLTEENRKNTTSSHPEKLPWEENDAGDQVAGWSYMCVQDIYTLRPIAGVMQFVADIELNPKSIEEAIWTTLHEITHVLVMDYDLFHDFIDDDFNRLGYEKTIKIKTRLKYLDSILEDRHHLMNDYLEFGRFERNSKEKDQDSLGKKKYYGKNELYEDYSSNMESLNQENNSSNNNDVFNVKVDNKLKSGVKTEKEYFENISENKEKASLKVNEEKLMKLRKSSDFLKITVVSDNPLRNETIKMNNFTNSSNSKNLTSEFTISLNSESTNQTNKLSNNSQTVYDLIKNNSLSTNFTKSKPQIAIDEIFNTGTYDEPTIKLPLLEDYYELTIYPNFNITTLAAYIENFIDNTKIYITTPKVLEMAKSHYNCKNLEGVELEHFGGLGSAYSHWSKRILNTEFLIADTYGEYYVSNISLALFEDSGWYKVDYSKSDKLLWGKDKGCSFLSEKCVVRKESSNPFFYSDSKGFSNKKNSLKQGEYLVTYDTNFKEEFCLDIDEEICSISNKFRATCGLKINQVKIPKQYQYFENPKVYAQNSFGDYCPYPVEWVDDESNSVGSCRNGRQIRKDLGEKVCENCRCFRSSLVEEKIYNTQKGKNDTNLSFNRYKDVRAACYETRCRENSSGKTELIVYLNDSEIVCPRGGGVISVDGYNGLIKCPKTEIICDGMMDPKANLSKTSGFILVADLPSKILNFYNEYFQISFNK